MSEVIVRGHFRPGSLRRGAGMRIVRPTWWVGRWTCRIASRFRPGSSPCLVANALAAAFGSSGRLDPTKAWIARTAGVCERQVTRAINQLVRLGFLTYQRRTAVTKGVEHQTSNAYQLQLPDPEERAESTPPPAEQETQEMVASPLESMAGYTQDSISPECTSSAILPDRTVRRPLEQLPGRAIRQMRAALEARRNAYAAFMLAERRRRLGDSIRVTSSPDVPY